MHHDKYVENKKNTILIENKQRGNISYYSINQVSDLLKEDINKIRYYTNIFDDILKIDILNKELRYTNKDINKLELLISLKNKGLTLKEIQDYYYKLPLDIDETTFEENNLLSVSELVESLIKAQQEQFKSLKSDLLNEITVANNEYINTITSKVISIQESNFTTLKSDLAKDIQISLEANLGNYKSDSLEFQNTLMSDITEIISEKIDNKNQELQKSLNEDLEKFSKSNLNNDKDLIKEVRDFKRVINNAYYTQTQVELETEHVNLFSRVLKRFSIK